MNIFNIFLSYIIYFSGYLKVCGKTNIIFFLPLIVYNFLLYPNKKILKKEIIT